MATKIFISYAKEDRPRAEMLAQTLEGGGWSTFWDRTIPIGKTWRETIGRELDGAGCVIVLWSKTSIESGWVQEEADDAKRRGVLVPILIENVQPPIGFRSIQAAHLENWDGAESTQAFRRLIADIAALVGSPPKEAEKERRQPEAEIERKALEERKRKRRLDEAEAEKRRLEEAAAAKRRRAEDEQRRQTALSFNELVDVVTAFFLRKGYGAERNVFLYPVPDTITNDAKVRFSISHREKIVAVLTSKSSDDRVVFTERAIHFRAKMLLHEKKDVVSYEELRKREPRSKITGSVIFAETTLATMPYLEVPTRDVIELLVAMRERLNEPSK
jgi:hypothetical protein